jgi:hypothetical protein
MMAKGRVRIKPNIKAPSPEKIAEILALLDELEASIRKRRGLLN